MLGSGAAGYRPADLMMLVNSAVCNDLDAGVYVKNIHVQLLAGDTDFDLMRRYIWTQAHHEVVGVYREVERRDRADAKRKDVLDDVRPQRWQSS